jgi:predicted O-linked N-acetylglucosamine transferase (SPINDLY family)
MTVLSQKQKIKLIDLFQKNKFLDIELEIESISNFKDRSAFLANMLGVAKLKKPSATQKDFEEARKHFKDSYEKDKNYIDAMCNFGSVSLKLRNFDYIFKDLKRFVKDKGYNAKVYETLSRILYFTGQIDEALKLYKEMADKSDLTKESSAHFLTSLNYSSKFSQVEYLDYCKKINKQFTPNDLDQLIKIDIDKNPKNLNIGFISPDFIEHSVTDFLFGTLEELKKKGFKIHAFNLRKHEQLDHTSNSLKTIFDGWHDLEKLSDLESANTIRKSKINILINLVGYFARNRFTIMKYKPAPIQMLWMGYINTTGIEEIDYIVADPNLIYKDEENLYSEKVIKLPKIWNCHSGIKSRVVSEGLPFLKNDYVTYGCFNNSSKITEEVIETWSEILLNKKNSKIIIKAPSEDGEIAQEGILKKFKEFNVDNSRVLFSRREEKRNDHYKIYNKIDISLDTFPYPGVTTSIESIWMGVPVLTLKGNNFVSRCGESINLNLKMSDFIAKNKTEYINKALSLTEDINNLVEIRKSLRQKALASPLFDTDKFGQDFGDLLSNVWLNHTVK